MTKSKHKFSTCRLDEVPPYCFMKPGMSPEEGAMAAVMAMKITHPLDVLVTRWTLRRVCSKPLVSAGNMLASIASTLPTGADASVPHESTPKHSNGRGGHEA